MEIERLKLKLAKILKLAEHGVGGEKNNAQAILAKMLKQHGISIDDLLSSRSENLLWKDYCYRNILERQLLFQCVSKVANTTKAPCRKYKKANKLQFSMRAIDHIELEHMYRHFRKLFAKEIETLFAAFVHKHDIYPSDQSQCSKSTEMNMEEIAQIIKLSRSLKDSDYVSTRRQLQSVVSKSS